MNKVYIYSLNDPDTLQIRYIGKTGNLKKRLYSHITEAKRSKGRRYVLNWINSLLSSNKKPIINIIEECNDSNWQERERYWVSYYREIIPNLCNNADGGLGGSGTKNYTPEELDKRRIIASKSFSKFTDYEKSQIWEDIQKYSYKQVVKRHPRITRSIYFHIKRGYCWNNITKLPKVRPNRKDSVRLKNSGINLSKSDIEFIKLSRKTITQKELSLKFGVSQSSVWRIQTKW